MKGCNRCEQTGVVNVMRQAPKTDFYKGVSYLPPRAELCQCVVAELGALRAALVGAGLLPADHWTRGLPPRGLTGSEPPERSYVVLSTRRDGYRIIDYGRPGLEALAPDGHVLRGDDSEPLWFARVSDAERSIDRQYPLEEDHGPEA